MRQNQARTKASSFGWCVVRCNSARRSVRSFAIGFTQRNWVADEKPTAPRNAGPGPQLCAGYGRAVSSSRKSSRLAGRSTAWVSKLTWRSVTLAMSAA